MTRLSSPRVVLDTNVLVAAGFRPRSASGRLAAAVRQGALVHVWCDATRAEADHLLSTIPPLRGTDAEALFPEAGRFASPLNPGAYPGVPGTLDRTFAALADAAGVPLVTADGPLAAGARAHGLAVLSPAAAARGLL